MNRKTLVVIGLLVCLLGFGFLSISYASNISNPFIVIKGVLKLEKNDTRIEIISNNPLTLIGKDLNDILNVIINFGYTFETREGDRYFFSKDNEKFIFTSKQFTKKYITFRLDT